jgi:hypothetical protein
MCRFRDPPGNENCLFSDTIVTSSNSLHLALVYFSITLFPPEDPMYTFPDIHRSHRQSQIPFDELSTTSANISELQHLLDKLGLVPHRDHVVQGFTFLLFFT